MTKDEEDDIRKKANDVADAIQVLADAIDEYHTSSVRRGEAIEEDVLPGWALADEIEKYRAIAMLTT